MSVDYVTLLQRAGYVLYRALVFNAVQQLTPVLEYAFLMENVVQHLTLSRSIQPATSSLFLVAHHQYHC